MKTILCGVDQETKRIKKTKRNGHINEPYKSIADVGKRNLVFFIKFTDKDRKNQRNKQEQVFRVELQKMIPRRHQKDQTSGHQCYISVRPDTGSFDQLKKLIQRGQAQ